MVANTNNDDEKDYHEGNDDDVDEDNEDNEDDCEAEACCRAFKVVADNNKCANSRFLQARFTFSCSEHLFSFF